MKLKLFTVFRLQPFSQSKQKFYLFFCISFLHCLPTYTASSLPRFLLLSCCEITICLIVGDSHTPQQLGCAQIIYYTRLSPFLFLVLFFTGLLSSVFSSGGGCYSSHSHICEVSALVDKWLE